MTTIALVGDLMLGGGVSKALDVVAPASVWGTTLPILRATDGVLGYLDCPITPTEAPRRRPGVAAPSRADPVALQALEAGNVRLVSLANSRMLDHGHGGLIDTIGYLERSGIRHAGAGGSLADARRPARLQSDGVDIAVLAVTDHGSEYAAGPTTPGTNYVAKSPPAEVIDWLERTVRSLKSERVDLIVLSLRWRTSTSTATAPSAAVQAFARMAVTLGVDVVWGHSAHAGQGVERWEQGVILYDAGGFLDDRAADREVRNDRSFLFLLDVSSGGCFERVRMVPVTLGFARVDLAHGPEARDSMVSLRDQSRALGTEISLVEGALCLSIDRSLGYRRCRT